MTEYCECGAELVLIDGEDACSRCNDVIDQADEPCSEFTESEQAWLEDERWSADLYAEVERHRERHEDDGAGVEPPYLSEGHDASEMPF